MYKEKHFIMHRTLYKLTIRAFKKPNRSKSGKFLNPENTAPDKNSENSKIQ